MRRRAVGRDLGLTLRMLLALVLLAAFYAGIGAGVVALFWWQVGWLAYGLVVVAVALFAALAHLHGSESLVLRSARARRRAVIEHRLQRHLERLAALADVPVPRLAVVDTKTPNAFTVGITPGRTVVAVTEGLSHALNDRELEAVLAHELTHIANRDASVMTVVSFPRTLGQTLIGDDSLAVVVLFVVWPLGLPLWALGTLLTLTVSRYREYAADRGAALLTGAPEQLMSALRKLSDQRIPSGDLRLQGPAEAFCIVPVRMPRFELFMDHPPLEKRLAALEELARTLGKPAR
jgi:heat shock protein HtpX